MHFRAQRKLQGEVSLSDAIETGPEGDALYLSDVVGEEDTMLEELQNKENRQLIRRLVTEVLTERAVRYQPQLCIAYREEGAGEAGGGFTGANLGTKKQ